MKFKVVFVLLLFLYSWNIFAENKSPLEVRLTSYTNQILVSMNDIREAKKYATRYSKKKDMTESVILEHNSVNLELQDLDIETLYYIQARVLNDSIWSEWSKIQNVKTASFNTTVGSYNILSSQYDSVFPNNTWETRMQAMKSIILQPDNNPDIFGVQEGMVLSQVIELGELLKNSYVNHISKRSVSPRAIFWKPDLYELVAFDDNIDILNKEIEGYKTTRYTTYIHLRDKETGKGLLVFNLHLPSNYSTDNSDIRNMMAENISKRAVELSERANNAPIIILGDFNSLSSSSDYEKSTSPMILEKNGFTDTFKATINRTNAYYGTHDRITTGVTTGGGNKDNCSKRIDYIFTFPKDKVFISDYRIIVNLERDSGIVLRKPIPSDHRPVRSTLHLHY